jgi:hypothetical protein
MALPQMKGGALAQSPPASPGLKPAAGETREVFASAPAQVIVTRLAPLRAKK